MIDSRKMIAKNIAAMLHDGDFVNLGIGIPTLVSMYVPKDMTVLLHGENGSIGQDGIVPIEAGHLPEWESKHGKENGSWKGGHKDLINAGCENITLIPGGSCFDSSVSFAMARGGHLDATILGGLQVDVDGNLANWIVPGKSVKGMGGAMDLVSGAKKVIVAMEHCSKLGEPKILKKCTMPLTAVRCVNTVVTELCVLECREGELLVKAIAPGVTKEELQKKTEATLVFSDDLKEMLLP